MKITTYFLLLALGGCSSQAPAPVAPTPATAPAVTIMPTAMPTVVPTITPVATSISAPVSAATPRPISIEETRVLRQQNFDALVERFTQSILAATTTGQLDAVRGDINEVDFQLEQIAAFAQQQGDFSQSLPVANSRGRLSLLKSAIALRLQGANVEARRLLLGDERSPQQRQRDAQAFADQVEAASQKASRRP